MILNLKNYKLAKIFKNDITKILEHVNQSIINLTPYIKYKPVVKMLAELRDQKSMLEAHLKNCNKIISDKGQVKE